MFTILNTDKIIFTPFLFYEICRQKLMYIKWEKYKKKIEYILIKFNVKQ